MKNAFSLCSTASIRNAARLGQRLCLSTTAAFSDEGTSVFWCGQVVFPEGASPGSVEVKKGKIMACHKGATKYEAEERALRSGSRFWDLGETNCLSPGLVDVHVHISALGRNWEGYTTATQAAAAGGITTLMGMPLNSLPPTTSPENFEMEKEEASQSQLYVDVALWGGVVPENCNQRDLNELLNAGVWGLKAFLAPLPPAAGYQAVSPEQLLEAAKLCGPHDKPILVHSELMTEEELEKQQQESYSGGVGVDSYQAHLNSRPPEWERAAVEVVCQAASYCRMHVVHLSDARCLERIQTTKGDTTKRLSVETCPHYLLLDSSRIADGDTRLKCFPPIRDADNREKLWGGLEGGWIDTVASDHSPCEAFMRCRDMGNLREAWGGLTGLQYQLQATWADAFPRKASLLDMANWWSRNPCDLAGMSSFKGTIEEGKQADLCWWDPAHKGAPDDYSQECHRWKGDAFYASNPTMRGRVLATWVRGEKVYCGETDEHQNVAGRFLEAGSSAGS